MGELPLDIQPQWFPLIRRLQSVAKSDGVSVITMKILVNKDGYPVFWLSPEVQYVEPRSKADLILSLVATEQKP